MKNTTKQFSEPLDMFKTWYNPVLNSGKDNSNAFALSTADKEGHVSSRVVLLKDFDRNGFIFYTNYQSNKGMQLSENPFASILFYWPDFKRQIRIEGSISKVSAAESDNYFNKRINGHKINALVSQQSKPIDSMVRYRLKMNQAAEQYADSSPKRPDHWGGYILKPGRYEFWEEGSSRFHNRIEYLIEEKVWTIRQLQP